MSKSRTAANSMFSEENDDKPNESNPNRGREIRSNNEPKTEDSSSSSIDSAGDKISQSKTNASTTIKDSSRILPSTTTNTDSESEQEEINTKATKNQTNISIPREENSRRVKHFRKLFQSEIKEPMPELIDSFVCAYQGRIEPVESFDFHCFVHFQATFFFKAKCTSPLVISVFIHEL